MMLKHHHNKLPNLPPGVLTPCLRHPASSIFNRRLNGRHSGEVPRGCCPSRPERVASRRPGLDGTWPASNIASARAPRRTSLSPTQLPLPNDRVRGTLEAIAERIPVERPTFDPDHHLMRRDGQWYVRLTLLFPDGKRKRLKRSTRTSNIERARQVRDYLIGFLMGSSRFAVLLRAQQRRSGDRG
jgi:hypothetical protein